MTNDSYSYWCI